MKKFSFSSSLLLCLRQRRRIRKPVPSHTAQLSVQCDMNKFRPAYLLNAEKWLADSCSLLPRDLVSGVTGGLVSTTRLLSFLVLSALSHRISFANFHRRGTTRSVYGNYWFQFLSNKLPSKNYYCRFSRGEILYRNLRLICDTS